MDSNGRTAGALPRLSIYLALGLTLLVPGLRVASATGLARYELHTLMEAVASLLAVFVGILALVRYYSRKEMTFLLVGTAFLGTGLLDGVHAAQISSFLLARISDHGSNLPSWGSLASRLFLAVCLWLGVSLLRLDASRGGQAASERMAFVATGLLTLASLLLLTPVPLPRALYPDFVISRPVELVAGLVFGLALSGYLRRGRFREDRFERWLVVSLAVAVVAQVFVSPFSRNLLDTPFTAGHLLKLASYAAVAAGLLESMYEMFREAEMAAAENHRQRIELENEIKERWRAEAELLVLAETLEERVAERTKELAWSRTAALNMMEDADEARRAAELAEVSLVRYARQLERSNADLQQFAYVASHDLQEPLRQMASYAQLLARRYRDRLDADANDFIDYMVDGARRMQQLIHDLLSFSRVGTRGGKMATIECDEVVQRVLADLQVPIEESEARVTWDPLPAVTADGVQLGQVFQNLLSNALKFRGESRPEVHISAEQRNGDWQFQVRDNGIGIRPEFAEKVFVIFQRLHGRGEYPGTGIGLAICKRIVERHEGRIWVEPNPAGGSTFSFTIPAGTGREKLEETHSG